MMDIDRPSNCAHCGCSPDANPLCEHLTPPKQEPPGKPEGKELHCPMCPLIYEHCSWLNPFKKLRLRKIMQLSKIDFMDNPYENYYKCIFCWYGVRA